ncbi:MAG: sugar phosphate isomerase/epimerase [Oscillospiraceae bacterium]|nr:sugar phosphate isomerase/epimerase [Oscillospiraceae bacterium]
MLPIALQVYSVRDEITRDPIGVLRQVKDMGYDGIELAGLYGYSSYEVRQALDDYGMKAISAHVAYDEMIANPDAVLGSYAAIGCSWVAIPHLAEHYRIGAEKYDEAIAGIKKIGEVAKKKGMTLLYHNHEFEFAKSNGEYALDLLYKAVPADLLQTQIDTCWAKVAGLDPAAYVRKYAGRAPVVHLKDYYMEGDSSGADTPRRNSTFRFRHLGAGMQDIPALVQASVDAGAQWLVVEQDMPTEGMTSIECARESLKCLRSI